MGTFLVPIRKAVYAENLDDVFSLTPRDRQDITRNLVGLAAMKTFYDMRIAGLGTEDYTMVTDGEGNQVDISAQFPLRQMSWLAEFARRGGLKEFGIESEVNIVSAHRTPDKMFKYASSAKNNGIKVIIAGAGGAAHLPGMVASITTLPVIGVPVKSRNSIDGWDSVLSILQMPNGVPVATVALNGAKNAGILAAQIIGISDEVISQKLVDYKNQLEKKVIDSEKEL